MEIKQTYAPPGMFLWDPWFAKKDNIYHLFHLQAKRTNEPDARHHNRVSIGHATSTNLIDWQTQPTAISPGDKGSWDDLSIWTGSQFYFHEKSHLFYTGRHQDQFWIQRIGIATSTDWQVWEKYEGNPILEADQQFYHMINEKNSLGVLPAFRDPEVFNYDGEYYMIFSARAYDQNPTYNGCIGIASSTDLIHWQLLPPLLAPHRHDEMEVPQMIIKDGSFYLFFMAYQKYCEPNWKAKMGAGDGLHCYRSTDLFGPYKPVNDNGVVLNSLNILGLRILNFRKNQYIAIGWLNTDKEGTFIGRLSVVMKVIIDENEVNVSNFYSENVDYKR